MKPGQGANAAVPASAADQHLQPSKTAGHHPEKEKKNVLL